MMRCGTISLLAARRGALLGLLIAVISLPAFADFEPFVVKDMRVEGLQRISEGTVFNYLPINIGDTIDDVRIREAIRALYTQGLFDDIEMRRDGDALIVAVKERPSIESFEIEGNKDIKTEDLMESLRGVGLAKGRTFDRSTLDNVAMFMREQYYDRGKYGVQVDTTVEDRPNNTVRIKIDVKEGDRAKIRQVNIVGNTSFDEDEIREDFNLDTGNWLSWLRQDDRYEKQGLEGDLETLRSFYMDRGFANFSIESTQVAISPNKKDIFVTITINEGDKYTISDVKLVGDLVVPEAYLRAMVLVDIQSRIIDAVCRIHVAATRRAGLCERRNRSGPGARSREQDSRDYVLRGSEESRLCPPYQFQRNRRG